MTKKKQSQKTLMAKKKLCQLSQQAKAVRQKRINKAETPIQALAAASLTINDILREFYIDECGSDEFNTFNQWKELGYKVKKNATAFRLWGKPIRATSKQEMTNLKTGEQEELESQYEHYPMASIFHISQVELISDQESNQSTSTTEDSAEQLPGAYGRENYDMHQQQKAAHYAEKAIAANKRADELSQQSRDIVRGIEPGQPILVGHHSEKRHRRDLDKSWNKLGQSVAESGKAEHYQEKAASVGTGGIASDDPQALQKLKEKKDKLVKNQEFMKAVNKAVRGKKTDELKALDLSEVQITQLLSMNETPYPHFKLTNNNAKIKATEKRIAELTALYAIPPVEYDCDDFKVFVEDGRVHIDFNGKPLAEVREALHKRYAFKWSRYSKTWVRKATLNAVRSTEGLISELVEFESIY